MIRQNQQEQNFISTKAILSSKFQREEHQILQEMCEICCQYYQKLKDQFLRPAMICYKCWYEHVKVNVTKISYMVGSGIISPFQGNDQIDVCIALNGLKMQDKLQLQEWLFKKYTTFTKDIEKCPSETCDYVFTMEKCNKWLMNQELKCPKCQISLAVSQEFTLKSIIGLVYFIFLANKCPKCQIPIQRISGCPHMTCPCGHQFCWFCLKDHTLKQNNLYSVHEPKQCAFIFFSKIIILMTCLLSLSCFLVGGETVRYVMSCIFDFLGYLIQSVLIDLYVLAQYMVINIYKNQRFRRLPFQYIRTNFQIMILCAINLLFLAILMAFQLFYSTLAILLIQVAILGFGALIVFSVIYTCQTWFQYIA